MLWIALLVASVLLLALAGSGVGSRVSFGGREKPERVVGARVVLSEFDGLGAAPPSEIEATIQEFIGNGKYRLVFSTTRVIAGRNESSATVSARHAGYPVSAASRSGLLAVAGHLQSGVPFIALIKRSREVAGEA